MKKLDLRLLRSIKNSKGQFISITVTIIVAIVIFVSFSMVADKLRNSIFRYYEITNFSDITARVSKIPASAVEDLLSIEGIEDVQGRVVADVPLRVEDPDEKVRVRIVSVPPEDDSINRLYTIAGEEIGDSLNSTAVIQQFFVGREMSFGDIITPYIGGKTYPLEVVGEVGSPEYIYLMENEQTLLPEERGFGIIYVTEEFAQSTLGFQGSYNDIVIKVSDAYQGRIDSIVDQLEDELERYGVSSVVKREDQLSHSVMMQEVDSLGVMSTAMTVVFLFVAAIIISIMLSRLVRKDRMAIGVMKAIGYTDKQVLLHYVKYAVLIGVAGSFIGVLISIPVSVALVKLYIQYMNVPVLDTSMDPMYFVYGITLTTSFCVAAGLFGSRSVMSIDPAEAMRPEAPKAGKRIFLEKIKSVWSKISFSWKMVIRSISRTKRRAVFLAIGIALTYAITMLPVYMATIWNTLLDKQYGELQKMDYSIDFAVPLSTNVMLDIKQLTDIDVIEPKIEMPLQVKNGWRKKTISVVAVPNDTVMYGFMNSTGTPLELPEEGLFLSDILARILNVKAGDFVEVKGFLPGIDEKELQVKWIVEQYLGANAYMDIRQMYRILEEDGIATGAYVLTDSDITADLKDIKNIRAVQSVGDMQEAMLEYMDMIIASMGTMMLFGGILGFAIVYNITTVSINERLMEFSSLRVMGFEKKEIFRMITRENALMTAVGIILGIPVGYGMIKALETSISTEIYTIPAIILPSTYVIALIATLIFVAIAQLATYRKIHNLNFMDALKNRVS
ncbi:FtsX-like permease family protein [Gudongella oleilytica]|uniref:ABC transporter permease n=1 Tax=Gudongella oleilytica TaxID=1582259 RepID=UPI002A36D7E3|nr:FtsX-like permease family protein [Gudongella oleilytica]MDY0255879.1 FtsX-like permease family protein [Gudongella oleilytica]